MTITTECSWHLAFVTIILFVEIEYIPSDAVSWKKPEGVLDHIYNDHVNICRRCSDRQAKAILN